jgi:hypothetical protein
MDVFHVPSLIETTGHKYLPLQKILLITTIVSVMGIRALPSPSLLVFNKMTLSPLKR